MYQTGWFKTVAKVFIVFFVCVSLSWAGEDEEEGASSAPEIEYLPVKPKLIVNLDGRRHYLRADIQLLVEDKENLERIRKHLPLIRHALIMHFSNLPMQKVADISQREQLRESALNEIRKVLDRYSDSYGLKDVFFTEFLVQ
ncbi:MAG: hypothetical protein AXA67_01420 [Methylothermaceae bacteria B42]|nr:MAG: hypothetical protein AXA67_01420 [Methylothermaceae bacteria B42]HHJ39062.1 flagellar basal body-associated FliL family protein [Methylothermaceae bacterium]